MKKVTALVAAVAALGFINTANAADIGTRAPVYKAPPPVAVFNWTGFYVGLNAGGAWGSAHQDYPPTTIPSTDGDFDGYFVGGTVGYNWQFNPAWVLGIEADIQGSKITGDIPNFVAGFPDTFKIDYWGTVRGRIGYAGWSHALLYATAGWAWAHAKESFPPALNFGSDSQTFSGWTVGGGIEYAIANNWSLKAEYLYADLGKESFVFPAFAPIAFDTKATMNVVRAGVNYRF
jgi:outer membrane immunogenic protein